MKLTCKKCNGKLERHGEGTLICTECEMVYRVSHKTDAATASRPQGGSPSRTSKPATSKKRKPQSSAKRETGSSPAWKKYALWAVPVVVLGILLFVFLPGGDSPSSDQKNDSKLAAQTGANSESPDGSSPKEETDQPSLEDRLASLRDQVKRSDSKKGALGTSIFGPEKNVAKKILDANKGRGQLPWGEPPWAVRISPDEKFQVDGLTPLPTGMVSVERPWVFVMSPGRHVLAFPDQQADGEMAEVIEGFVTFYQKQAASLRQGDRYDFDKLLEASEASYGVFREPLLPHHWGNYFWQDEEPEAAVRMWKRAIRIEPTFAPAHLNLAFAYVEQGETVKAQHELALASVLNFQNAYGLAEHLRTLRIRLNLSGPGNPAPELFPSDYREGIRPLDLEEQRVVGVLNTFEDLAVELPEQVKASNNIGVYLASRNRTQRAITQWESALGRLAESPDHHKERPLALHLLANLERTSREAGMGEHRFYAGLHKSLQQTP